MTSGVADILSRIVDRRRQRLGAAGSESQPRAPLSEPMTPDESPFLRALDRQRGRGVIAEVKMGSPRLGSLAGRVDPIAQVESYASGGAAAVSVVVEPDFFHGSYELLERCRLASALPTLAKDFLVHPCQLAWARDAGADAILLIAALYEASELASWAAAARGCGLVPLVELHDAADLDKLAGSEWELLGVNNRDLRTFVVSLEHSIDLLPLLPAGAIKVAESGIGCATEVERLRAAGFDAFLIGESLLLSDDPAAKLAELLG